MKTSLITSVKFFDRNSVKRDKKYNYIFTDNSNRKSGSANNLVIEEIGETWYTIKYGRDVTFPFKSQARIRGLENAFPISTMKAERVQWVIEDFNLFKKIIDDEIRTIKVAQSYKPFKINLSKKIGRGTFSRLPDSLLKYLDKKLLEIGIDNTNHQPTIIP